MRSTHVDACAEVPTSRIGRGLQCRTLPGVMATVGWYDCEEIHTLNQQAGCEDRALNEEQLMSAKKGKVLVCAIAMDSQHRGVPPGVDGKILICRSEIDARIAAYRRVGNHAVDQSVNDVSAQVD